MRDKVECAWCLGKLPLYLRCELAEDDRAAIRRHLETCPDCRGELGGYFLLDRWAEDALPTQSAPDGFTAAIVEQLPDYPRVKIDRRVILRNYLAAAAATLILIFTNVFGTFTDLASQADRLNAGARGISVQTQRMVEAPPRWLDSLKSRFQINQQSQEGSKTNAQE